MRTAPCRRSRGRSVRPRPRRQGRSWRGCRSRRRGRAVLCFLAGAGVVAVYRAIAESRAGRRGEPVELTDAAARRLLTPQTVLSLVGALAVMIVGWKVMASGALPHGVGTSTPAALLALAAGGWVFWTAMVLPRRAIDLARER